MGIEMTRDFSALLDELIAERDIDDGPMRAPRMPFDVLADMPEGAGGTISDPMVAAEYLFAVTDQFSIIEDAPPLVPEMPSTEPFDIALELRLTGKETAGELDRLRRDFAFANHPDRVAADLRDVAMIRMQIANRMIDDAKQRAGRA